ncbi:MAG: type II toxin-antitoxin system RelE/ParE family toxin [Clostridiales bacterium]|nr:type II toxin-antitoxin system RelE/ParE family toxin [Clostridiales bacterium]
MKYQVIRTDKFDEQLWDIIFYIAEDSGSREIALGVLERIEHAVNVLYDFPYSGVVPRYATLRRQGYRILIAEKYLLFYKVDEENKTVILYAVFDARQEYRKLL